MNQKKNFSEQYPEILINEKEIIVWTITIKIVAFLTGILRKTVKNLTEPWDISPGLSGYIKRTGASVIRN